MFLKLLVISSVLVGFAFIGLAFRTLFIKEGRFPQTSVGKNKEMHKLGITCAKHDEMQCYRDVNDGGCCC